MVGVVKGIMAVRGVRATVHVGHLERHLHPGVLGGLPVVAPVWLGLP